MSYEIQSRAAVEPVRDSDDSGRGQALFFLFVGAVALVTGAVAALALLGSWWLLGVVFGVHLVVTLIVGAAVFAILGDGKLLPQRVTRAARDTARDETQPARTEPIAV